MASDSDEMQFVNEAPAAVPAASPASPKFKLMIIDDDKDVHLVTKQVLSTYFPKSDMPHFLHAYNSLDAYTMLAWERDVAVVLLDVVMESDDAGLKLINSIRNDLNLSRTQIILRTGQPGLASEDRVIADYEINGYLAKSDLTPGKLYSAVTAARRSYSQLSKEFAAASLLGGAPAKDSKSTSPLALDSFTLDSMVHIAAFIQSPCMGFVLRRAKPDQALMVSFPTPEFATLSGVSLEALRDASFSERVARCLQQRESIIDAAAATLYLPWSKFPDGVMHLIRKPGSSEVDTRPISVLVNTYVKVSEHLLSQASVQ